MPLFADYTAQQFLSSSILERIVMDSPAIEVLNEIVDCLVSNHDRDAAASSKRVREVVSVESVYTRFIELSIEQRFISQHSSVGSQAPAPESLVDLLEDLHITDKNAIKTVREKALEAFYDDGLRPMARITAMVTLVAAIILENAQHPEEALLSCMLHLEEFHSMMVVKNSFKIILGKTFLKKNQRELSQIIIASVCQVNKAIFKFAQIAGRPAGQPWPCVNVEGTEINPLEVGRGAIIRPVKKTKKGSILGRQNPQESRKPRRLDEESSASGNRFIPPRSRFRPIGRNAAEMTPVLPKESSEDSLSLDSQSDSDQQEEISRKHHSLLKESVLSRRLPPQIISDKLTVLRKTAPAGPKESPEDSISLESQTGFNQQDEMQQRQTGPIRKYHSLPTERVSSKRLPSQIQERLTVFSNYDQDYDKRSRSFIQSKLRHDYEEAIGRNEAGSFVKRSSSPTNLFTPEELDEDSEEAVTDDGDEVPEAPAPLERSQFYQGDQPFDPGEFLLAASNVPEESAARRPMVRSRDYQVHNRKPRQMIDESIGSFGDESSILTVRPVKSVGDEGTGQMTEEPFQPRRIRHRIQGEEQKRTITPSRDNFLDAINPVNQPPLTVLDKNGIRIIFHFAELNEKAPKLPVEDLVVVVIAITSSLQSAVENFCFRPEVPKPFMLKLRRPSADNLPACEPFHSPAIGITQVMLIGNPTKEKIRLSLRFMASYHVDGKVTTETGDVDIFPNAQVPPSPESSGKFAWL